MTLAVDVPGVPTLRLEHLLLDVNGTLTRSGDLLDGVAERLRSLAETLEIRLLSADTFGTLDRVAQALGAHAERVGEGAGKLAVAERLGASSCVAVGNGRNDVAMLEAAGLGIAVVGPEGAASSTLLAADVVCASIADALDLLLDERALVATLRA